MTAWPFDWDMNPTEGWKSKRKKTFTNFLLCNYWHPNIRYFRSTIYNNNNGWVHTFVGAYPLMSLMKNRYAGDGVVVETNHSHHYVAIVLFPLLLESNQLIKQFFPKRKKFPTKLIFIDWLLSNVDLRPANCQNPKINGRRTIFEWKAIICVT